MRLSQKLTMGLLAGFAIMLFLVGPAWAADTTGFDLWQRQTIDDANKVWEIRFNMPLDQASITNDHIYILTGASRVDTKLTNSTDGYMTYVTPLKAYEIGKEYTLFITNKVTSKNGHRLSTPIAVPFILIDKNAKIQHVTSHYSSFLTMVTVFTSPDVHRVKIGTSDEMHFQGNNTYTLGLPDLKQGTRLTIRAYDESNRLLETKKHTL